jgi:hypothetical protein
MRWNWKYAFISMVILALEICIALFVNDRFIRPFFGDVLAVVLVYTSLRTILKAKAFYVLIGVFIFACSLEFLQYLQIAKVYGLDDYKVLRIILGSTFDWWDILAYFLGCLGIYFLDRDCRF